MTKPVIGFIGLGLMGRGMATNILKNGYPLVTMAHRRREAVDALVAQGAAEVASPAEMASRCDVIHLCVTGSPQVEAVVRGPDGILAGGHAGLVVIDCSTADPVSTLALADELRAAGMALVDAPLSRTPKEAMEGTLDTMVGADPEVFDRVRPVIETWAGVIVHLGAVGLGHTMKLINNMIAMGYAALYAESLALARMAGLSAEQFDSVIRPGRLSNGFYETFMKWTLERDENAHRFVVHNALKDMDYVGSLVNSLGGVNPMHAAIRNSFAAMVAAGQGDRYVPMLADFVAGMNGLDTESGHALAQL
ncbi:MAG: NAD(P)-dependent oxidoreductase [Gammaproteobacteria bacterium]|nr:NAD(P)-dependent oxidoreductase [Gammaproteobacteria bacterium]